MYTIIPTLTASRFFAPIQGDPSSLPFGSLSLPDYQACRLVIQHLPQHPSQYPQSVQWTFQQRQHTLHSTCFIVIRNVNIQDLPTPGDEVHWPGIYHMAQRIVETCFGQSKKQNYKVTMWVPARQWSRSLDPEIVDEILQISIYLLKNPMRDLTTADLIQSIAP
jgi:hypothetical protein